MKKTVLHPDKTRWAKVVFPEGLSEFEIEDRKRRIYDEIQNQGRPIVGGTGLKHSLDQHIPPRAIDFLVVGVNSFDNISEPFQVLIQYWDDVEAFPHLTTDAVMFSFLKTADGSLYSVGYATFAPSSILALTTTW